MLIEKEIRFSHLFSEKPRKNLHLTQQFDENFAHLLKKPKHFLHPVKILTKFLQNC